MKRRVISLIISLALCLSLCPTQALASNNDFTLQSDMSGSTYSITRSVQFNGRGYTYTVSNATAMSVQSGGKLTLTNGKVKSGNGAGVEVKSGGALSVEDPNMTVIGTTYGLDISSGAVVQLSGGTFTATNANGMAIHTQDGNYSALLKDGYAFFDESDIPIPLTEVAGKTTVTVKACTDHVYDYTANPKFPTHSWTCLACHAEGTAPCTFDFDTNGHAKCADCDHTLDITITLDDDSLVYNGTGKPTEDSVTVTVTLGNGTDSTTLTKGVDYTVTVKTGVNAGEIAAVTVTDITTYNGTWTYKKEFRVTQAEPKIRWNTTDPVTVFYDGNPVDESDLPRVTITPANDGDMEELERVLYFSYRKNGEANFTDGLPTDAGTYEIKASLLELKNYKAAETNPCLTLTIDKIPTNDMVIIRPEATKPFYNGTAQELVTGGALNPGAVGAVILFAQSADGPWSTDIPTGINADSYEVWYKVDGTDNYDGVGPEKIEGVEIQRKPVTPTIELEYYTCVYNGGYYEPRVTVKDGETVLPSTEYTVAYDNNKNVSTPETPATVIVSDKDGGNYAIKPPEGQEEPKGVVVTFQITAADQAALTITGQRPVVYGDKFTLGTTGGSGNGTVTWEIIDGDEIAEIGEKSGQVTVTGLGVVTVRATKSGTDNDGNHKDATAEWTFTIGPKPVTAVVTAANKPYDGDDEAEITAEIPAQDIVSSGDIITITGLTGTFSDANAGTNKTVTVDTNGANVTIPTDGQGNEKYIVTVPTTPVRADITKAATEIKITSTDNSRPYDGTEQALVTAAEASTTTGVTVTVEYALSESGPYSTAIPKATNAGSYTVWYRAQSSDNYFGTTAAKVDVTISRKSVTAYVTLTPDSYVYDGTPKQPTATVKDADGKEIPSTEYTVAYSNHVNVGTATVTVTAKEDGNYKFDTVQKNFEITTGGKAVLTSSPQARNLTYNGNPQDLVTVGTATGGSLVYAWKEGNAVPEDDDYEPTIPKGINAGEYTVYYKVKGDGNYVDSDVFHISVAIQPKTVTSPAITLVGENDGKYSVSYSGQRQEPTVASVVDDGKTIDTSEYTVTYSNNVNAGTATVHINDKNGGNYTVNGSTTFEITKAQAQFTTTPTANPLTYNAKAQPLITAGAAEGGTAVYWLDGGVHSTAIPTGTDCGTYTVWAQVLGDANHEDSVAQQIENVKIDKNTVKNPTIELSSYSFRYNGSEQKPTVTVKDDKGNVIPANEYTVIYGDDGESTVDVGTYKVTIKSKEINYIFEFDEGVESSKTFKILPEDQTPLTITGKRDTIYYGDTIQLSTTGGSGNGTVTWSIVGGTDIAEIGETTGQLKITGVGKIVITATRTPATSNYAETEDTWEFYAYQKPVTAVVTAEDLVYTGNLESTVNLTVTVPGTTVKIKEGKVLTGKFDDPNVGINKTVTFTINPDDLDVTNGNYYNITYPTTTTASITPAPASITGVTQNSLTYDGSEQALVTAGTVTGGDLAYSLNGVDYTRIVPTGKNAGTYTVWYKVIADSNHTDSEAQSLKVTIAPKSVSPTVMCSPETFPYDGTQKTPNIIVMDGTSEIPVSEYTVTFDEQVRIEIGDYKFTVTAKDGGNYKFDPIAGRTFKIIEASQAPLSIVFDKSTNVYYGDTFRLSAVGGSGDGIIIWAMKDPDAGIAAITQDGVVTVEGVGSFTVTAYRNAAGSYDKSNEDSITFTANPKPVTPVITVDDKLYNGTTNATLRATWNSGDLVFEDNIPVTVTGHFSSADVGTDKQVVIESVTPSGIYGNYNITYPATATGTIRKVDAKMAPEPTALNRDYDTTEAALVTAGATENGIGTVEYSLDEKGVYSTLIPSGKNAGIYTVWYRVAESVNWTGIGPVKLVVTIEKATPTFSLKDPPASSEGLTINCTSELEKLEDIALGELIVPSVLGTFAWVDGSIKPEDGGSYHATFTPNDTDNYNTVTIQVTVTVTEPTPGEGNPNAGNTGPSTGSSTNTPSAGGSSTESASTQTTVRDGTASTVLNTMAGDKLVDEAVANGSQNVVIKPEITGDVTKTEVLIPVSAVNRLQNETDAALTISTPIANVTIPNGALDALSSAGDIVSIVTEQIENTIVLTLTADGEDVGNISLTLTVQVEGAGPGTVAVLVYEDGKRETIRKSVVGKDGLYIPLNGSATVEIVDNSKEFTDVSAEYWAADAVAFASAHELFIGTAEATFSPELSISRAMLATVLHNLEGNPDQSLTDVFNDIDSGTWYEESVSWAAANGIVIGYGSGQFGPDDSITREQIAVMLWRYAGSPAADEYPLNFTDAGQASSYAMEALYWATANGIINGFDDGRLDPCGLATRAQAAQLLKNFIENT